MVVPRPGDDDEAEEGADIRGFFGKRKSNAEEENIPPACTHERDILFGNLKHVTDF